MHLATSLIVNVAMGTVEFYLSRYAVPHRCKPGGGGEAGLVSLGIGAIRPEWIPINLINLASVHLVICANTRLRPLMQCHAQYALQQRGLSNDCMTIN